jgi:cyclic beta-1,2-glucan synthetase
MDFDSREFYRKRVAFIARHSDCTESQVAQGRARSRPRRIQTKPSDDERIQRRRIHVGYYLIDKGFPQLAARTGFHPPLIDGVRAFIRAQADNFYITGIQLITIFFIAL